METKGDCSLPGESGERGCMQYLPSTWEAYSNEVLGYVAEQTPENEQMVSERKLALLVEEGYSDREIFLIWNQGHPGTCRRGINRHGVRYDSCAYAEKGLSLLGG